jgi:hypothetical protein
MMRPYPATAFDTHAAIQHLLETGMPQAQAKGTNTSSAIQGRYRPTLPFPWAINVASHVKVAVLIIVRMIKLRGSQECNREP